MKAFCFFAAFACLVALAVARIPEEDNAYVELPYEFSGPANPSETLKFYVALEQNERGLKKLEKEYELRTNPASPLWRQWLSSKEVMDMTAPPKALQQRVVEWFQNGGVEAKTYGDFLICEGTVESLNALLKIELNNYRHMESGRIVTKSLKESHVLPEGVAFVSGLHSFPVDRRLHTRPVEEETEDAVDPTTKYAVVPSTLRNVYNIPANAQASPKATMAVVEFGNGAGISFQSLSSFLEETNTPAFNISYIVGDWLWSPFNPIDGEATLDVQYGMAMAVNSDFSFWTVQGWMYEFTSLVQQRQQDGDPVAQVFSMSYGWAEAQQCRIAPGGGLFCVANGDSETYVLRQNTEFQKVGLTGVSLVGLSQDAGAASKWNMQCNKTPLVNPSYPGSSPYILTLGATMLVDATEDTSSNREPVCDTMTCASGGTEVVCSVQTGALITSGGGFGLWESMPAWQSSVVNQYLKTSPLLPPADMYNATNRGEPDVAALGHQYAIRYGTGWTFVDGTSASAPVFAGLVTLWNDYLIGQGKSPLGPLNSWIYSMAAAQPNTFNDITVGNNTATESPNTCTTPGYGAAVGWDACTGLGTPNFGNIMEYLTKNG